PFFQAVQMRMGDDAVMLQHTDDNARMNAYPTRKLRNLCCRARPRGPERVIALKANEHVGCPCVSLLLDSVSFAALVIHECSTLMQDDVRGLMKKSPPEMVIRLHP